MFPSVSNSLPTLPERRTSDVFTFPAQRWMAQPACRTPSSHFCSDGAGCRVTTTVLTSRGTRSAPRTVAPTRLSAGPAIGLQSSTTSRLSWKKLVLKPLGWLTQTHTNINDTLTATQIHDDAFSQTNKQFSETKTNRRQNDWQLPRPAWVVRFEVGRWSKSIEYVAHWKLRAKK